MSTSRPIRALLLVAGVLVSASAVGQVGESQDFIFEPNNPQVIIGGTVTSVGWQGPAELSCANSPVTSSGSIDCSWASQNQKLVLMSPNSGSGAPAFRVLRPDDFANWSSNQCLAAPTAGTWSFAACSAGSGAPTTATYWTATAEAGLSAEVNLGGLTTGLIFGTVSGGVSTPSTYGGTSCTNQIPTALSAAGVATCTTPSTSTDFGTIVKQASSPGTAQPSANFNIAGTGNMTLDNIGVSPTRGLGLLNTYASTAGATTQFSPYLEWEAHAYNSTSGLDEKSGMRLFVRPTNNTGATTAVLRLDTMTNGAAYSLDKWHVDLAGNMATAGNYTAAGTMNGYLYASPTPGTVASGATIEITRNVTIVSGTTTINTINVGGFPGGCIFLIPSGAWATGTSGNISIVSTAVVGKTMALCYDGTKFNPSY